MKKIAIALVVLLLAGEAFANDLVPAGKASIGRYVEVETPHPWSFLGSTLWGQRVWTVDGMELLTFDRISDGRPLVWSVPNIAPYKAGMTAEQLRELALNNIQGQYTAGGVNVSPLEPASLGGHPGIRINYSAIQDSGLRIKGLIFLAQHNGYLDAVRYEAPEMYFFELHRPQIETIVASLRFKE